MARPAARKRCFVSAIAISVCRLAWHKQCVRRQSRGTKKLSIWLADRPDHLNGFTVFGQESPKTPTFSVVLNWFLQTLRQRQKADSFIECGHPHSLQGLSGSSIVLPECSAGCQNDSLLAMVQDFPEHFYSGTAISGRTLGENLGEKLEKADGPSIEVAQQGNPIRMTGPSPGTINGVIVAFHECCRCRHFNTVSFPGQFQNFIEHRTVFDDRKLQPGR